MKTKRLLAWVLALCLVLSGFTFPVSAADTKPSNELLLESKTVVPIDFGAEQSALQVGSPTAGLLTEASIGDFSATLNWEMAVTLSESFSIQSIESVTDSIMMVAHENTDTNWYGRDLLVFLDDNLNVYCTVYLDNILRELGIVTSDLQNVCVNQLTAIDDMFYISYSVRQESSFDEWNISVKTGFLRIENNAQFEPVYFPYEIWVDDWVRGDQTQLSLRIEKSKDIYVVYSVNEYSNIGNEATYYISKDLKNWSVCTSPKFTTSGYMGQQLKFNVALTTDEGVYFHAYNTIAPTDYYEEYGVYFTKDFQTYTCITENFPEGMCLGNFAKTVDGKLVLLGYVREGSWWEGYLDTICLYLYDEVAGENSECFMAEINPGEYILIPGRNNYRSTVQLWIPEGKETKIYSFSCFDGMLLDEKTLPIDFNSVVSVHTGTINEKADQIQFMDSVIFGSGDYELISGDLFRSVYRITLPTEIAKGRIYYSVYSYENDQYIIIGENSVYFCSLHIILDQLPDFPILTDPATGVSVTSADGINFPEDVTWTVKIAAHGENSSIYDLSLAEYDGGDTLEGWFRVQIPLLDGTDSAQCALYYTDETGGVVEIYAIYLNGYLVFLTNHLGKYVLLGQNAAPSATHTATVNGVTGEYAPGDEVELTVPAAYTEQGWAYRFVGWSGDIGCIVDPGSPDTAFIMPDRDVVLTPVYVLVGDLNGDGVLDASDALNMARMLSGSVPENVAGDIDGDGVISTGDLVYMRRYLAGTYVPTK